MSFFTRDADDHSPTTALLNDPNNMSYALKTTDHTDIFLIKSGHKGFGLAKNSHFGHFCGAGQCNYGRKSAKSHDFPPYFRECVLCDMYSE